MDVPDTLGKWDIALAEAMIEGLFATIPPSVYPMDRRTLQQEGKEGKDKLKEGIGRES